MSAENKRQLKKAILAFAKSHGELNTMFSGYSKAFNPYKLDRITTYQCIDILNTLVTMEVKGLKFKEPTSLASGLNKGPYEFDESTSTGDDIDSKITTIAEELKQIMSKEVTASSAVSALSEDIGGALFPATDAGFNTLKMAYEAILLEHKDEPRARAFIMKVSKELLSNQGMGITQALSNVRQNDAYDRIQARLKTELGDTQFNKLKSSDQWDEIKKGIRELCKEGGTLGFGAEKGSRRGFATKVRGASSEQVLNFVNEEVKKQPEVANGPAPGA